MEKQQIKISEIKAELEKEARIIAESELYSQKIQKASDFNCCCYENNVIGRDTKLIWHLSDLKHFKDLTKGHFVIMGRKTSNQCLKLCLIEQML